MEKGRFIFELSPECVIDIASIDTKSWSKIKENVRFLMESKQSDDIGKAYIIAFIIYVAEFELLIPEYNPESDKMM